MSCSGRACTIPACDLGHWHEVLNRTDGFDFYHLPEYHLMAQELGEGKGVLFVYQENSQIAAWPFMIRPVETLPGLSDIGDGFQDASSVYGYPGPVVSSGARCNPEFLARFGEMIRETAAELRLVSMFSRLNPLLQDIKLIHGVGTVRGLGETVSIDLSLSAEAQWASYRENHRRNIRKAHRQGMRAYRDRDWTHFDRFVQLYKATMERLDADKFYQFDARYFHQLRRALGHRSELFVAEHEGQICCAAYFVHTGNVIQYHLSGTDAEYARLAPLKLVVDAARLWGNDAGARFLHLGGGVGSKDDGLFRFKAGFSMLRHRFSVWHWVALPDVYEACVTARHAWLLEQGLDLPSSGFFPQYRGR